MFTKYLSVKCPLWFFVGGKGVSILTQKHLKIRKHSNTAEFLAASDFRIKGTVRIAHSQTVTRERKPLKVKMFSCVEMREREKDVTKHLYNTAQKAVLVSYLLSDLPEILYFISV